MRTVIFKSCFKEDMQSFMEYRVATFAWNTYRLDNYRLSSFDMNITVRQSRQSGVARATCPD